MKAKLFGASTKWWEIIIGGILLAAPFIAIMASM